MFFIKDDSITFQPTDEERAKFAPITEGEHIVTVNEASFDQDEKGSCLKLELVIDDQDNPFNRRKIWENAYFDGDLSEGRLKAGQRKMNEVLTICNAPGFETQEQANMTAMRLIGQTFIAVTSNREWEGKIYTNVKRFKPLSGTVEAAPAPAPKKPTATMLSSPQVRKVTTTQTKAFR